MISAFKRTFNRPHTMITHREPPHLKYVAIGAGISPPKKKLPASQGKPSRYLKHCHWMRKKFFTAL